MSNSLQILKLPVFVKIQSISEKNWPVLRFRLKLLLCWILALGFWEILFLDPSYSSGFLRRPQKFNKYPTCHVVTESTSKQNKWEIQILGPSHNVLTLIYFTLIMNCLRQHFHYLGHFNLDEMHEIRAVFVVFKVKWCESIVVFLAHLHFKMKSKLYIPSTLNIDFILWHPQLIVDAVKC